MKGKLGTFVLRLTVSLTGSDYDTLNALAEMQDVSVSWAVRRAIEEYVRKHQKEIASALAAARLRGEGGAASR